MGWTSLIMFLALACAGLWLANRFLGKSGLMLFSGLAVILASSNSLILPAFMGRFVFSMTMVIMPVVLVGLYVSHKLHNEGKRVLLLDLICLAVVFVCEFFVAAWIDVGYGGVGALSWDTFGPYFATAISLVVCCFVAKVLLEKLNLEGSNPYFRRTLFFAIIFAIDAAIFSFVTLTFSGMAFGDILLTFVIRLAIESALAFGAAYFVTLLGVHTGKKTKSKKATKTAEPAEKKTETAKTEK